MSQPETVRNVDRPTMGGPTMDGTGWGLLILLSILWGGSFFFAGVAVQEIPPITLVFYRVLLAALVLLPLFFWAGHRLPSSLKDWLPFLGMGVLNNALPFGFIFAGQLYIGVGLASIINALTPLFAILVIAGAGDERLTSFKVIGLVLGVLGVVVLKSATPWGADTLGIILCLAGAFSYGLAALWARRFLVGVPPLKSATGQLLSSSAVMGVAAVMVDQPWTLPLPNTSVIWSVVTLAIVSTALAYLIFFRIIVRAGPANAMLVTLLVPVSAILLGIIFLGEVLAWTDIAGALIIALGLLFIDGRPVRWIKGKLGF